MNKNKQSFSILSRWKKVIYMFFVLLISASISFSCKKENQELVEPEPEVQNPTFFNNGLALSPPMGWSSWNSFRLDINETIVKEMADAMVSTGMKDAGYLYVNIDDGWQGGRTASGEIFVDSVKFPNGMKAIADYIHSKGLKAGIYTVLGPDKNDRLGSFGFYERDMKTFAAWGFDYIKVDINHVTNRSEGNLKKLFSEMSTAVLNCGRPMVFSICGQGKGNPFNWAYEIGNLWRVGHDIDYWNWEDPTQNSLWNGILYEIDMATPFDTLAGPGHWNDLDMMVIGGVDEVLFKRPYAGKLTLEEEKAHFAMWCIIASPLIAGNDLRNMSPETTSILTNEELIAVNQDVFGKQAKLVSNKNGLQIYLKALEKEKSGKMAVALFNRNLNSAKMNLNAEVLGLNGEFKIRDLTTHQDLGSFENYSIDVPEHGVVVLKVIGNLN